MTQDWRLYEMLTKADWRPGDEPRIENKITIRYEGRVVVIPLPAEAEVVEIQQVRESCGVEMDRLVVDWYQKCQEVEKKLARYEPPPKCSGCGHNLGIEWVCEGIDAPECGGHDG